MKNHKLYIGVDTFLITYMLLVSVTGVKSIPCSAAFSDLFRFFI
jgi:hypothetical protein